MAFVYTPEVRAIVKRCTAPTIAKIAGKAGMKESALCPRLVLALGGFFLALSVRASGQASPPRPAASPDPDTAHFALTAHCSASRTRPRSAGEWEGLVEGLGFRRKDRESFWSLATTAGELRAEAFFRSDETSCWIMFFPASAEPVPDTILSHLLKDARYTTIDADKLEIGLAPIEQLSGGGTKARNITVTLGGGRFIASRTVIQWK